MVCNKAQKNAIDEWRTRAGASRTNSPLSAHPFNEEEEEEEEEGEEGEEGDKALLESLSSVDREELARLELEAVDQAITTSNIEQLANLLQSTRSLPNKIRLAEAIKDITKG